MNLTDNEKLIIEKQMKIRSLFVDAAFAFPEMKFFDVDSENLLDEKIEVLEAINAGKTIAEIPRFYDVLELMPKAGIWD